MKEIKLTQKQQTMLNNYNNSNMHGLRDLYTSYSTYKARAEQNILDEMHKRTGYGYKITGGNSCTFSCAYCYDTRENGDINTHLVYHTHANKYDFIINIQG